MSAFEELKLVESEVKNPCKGLFFRGYKSSFIQDGRIEWKEGLRLLKRKSCPGCEKCRFMLDDIGEYDQVDNIILPKDGIEDGALYTIGVTNITTDWETGHCDGYDFEVMKV